MGRDGLRMFLICCFLCLPVTVWHTYNAVQYEILLNEFDSTSMAECGRLRARIDDGRICQSHCGTVSEQQLRREILRGIYAGHEPAQRPADVKRRHGPEFIPRPDYRGWED